MLSDNINRVQVAIELHGDSSDRVPSLTELVGRQCSLSSIRAAVDIGLLYQPSSSFNLVCAKLPMDTKLFADVELPMDAELPTIAKHPLRTEHYWVPILPSCLWFGSLFGQTFPYI